MAVGYHKINTSAARSGRRNTGGAYTRPPIVEAGLGFKHPIYGDVLTMQDFVSDRDCVECRCTHGKLQLSGGFIREWKRINDDMNNTDCSMPAK